MRGAANTSQALLELFYAKREEARRLYPDGVLMPSMPEQTSEPYILESPRIWGYPIVELWSDGRVTTRRSTPDEDGGLSGSY